MISTEKILGFASEAGFTACGVSPASPLIAQDRNIESWLRNGYDSGLSYMHRNREKRSDPGLLFEGAKSIVVCAAAYRNKAWDQRENHNPRISSYAIGTDYHITVKNMLHDVLQRIVSEYPGVRGRCFTDSAPVLEKSWAVEAGLGWRGKNSLILTPEAGSFVFLGEIILDTDADIYSTPYAKDGCGSCTACIDACPTSAIVAPYIIDTGRCISRLTTEKLPDSRISDTQDTHGWIFGCDICQSVCPHNRRPLPTGAQAFVPVFDPTTAGRDFWEKLDEQSFDRIFGKTPMARTGYTAIKERAMKIFSSDKEK